MFPKLIPEITTAFFTGYFESMPVFIMRLLTVKTCWVLIQTKVLANSIYSSGLVRISGNII